ncbi:hypothetical protein [cf. Phormidesmis sp. LEGE 11477]|uniref:alpha/beta fold hydrolase n=1 Tax=cf. Phormidesmis sp. LEGE 11477 TaxID=1828680 RepID=UPI001880FB52|nr:hypothetical protein [cf. Phormidesmis sp. LEGE 11477]MBE9061941.1 hypothetical protein [cf. Phormidesmis sp. LEGE 11477]
MTENQKVTLAGVPALIRSPKTDIGNAPLIVLWHGYGPPSSEQALAELLPLDDVPAWKVYPTLPMFGDRLPEGGIDEIMRRQMSDYVLELLLPTVERAVAELPQVTAGVERQFGADISSIGLFGFSAGAATVTHALLDGSVKVRAAVLAGAPASLDMAVSNFEKGSQIHADYLRENYDWFKDEMLTYSWSDTSKTARSRFDLGGRSSELLLADIPPAVLLTHGEQDEMYSVAKIRALGDTLRATYETNGIAERTDVQTFPHIAHHLDPTAADETEVEAELSAFREIVSAWYQQHLFH